MDMLRELSQRRVLGVNSSFKRYLYEKINWNDRFIGIVGARGVGKTTLLLQRLKGLNDRDALFVSLDSLYFSENKLIDFAESFYREGGRYLFLDEVHKYPNWSQELKNIYDFLPELKVVFTSSSALEIYKGQFDLSRRVISYVLQGLSFREFLALKHGKKVPVFKLQDILEDKSLSVNELLDNFKPYKYLGDYLNSGYYPFFLEGEENYHRKLLNAINLVLETDLPAANHIDYYAVIKLKKLLYIISRIVPYTPNVSQLSGQIGTTRDTLLKYLSLLHNAHIIRWLSSDAFGINFLNKPDKIYLENTNIGAALNFEGQSMEKGHLRETFVLNQLSVSHQVTYPKEGDFMVDGRWLLEVGGRSKGLKQIKGKPDAFIVSDEIEYRAGQKIPLWMLGLLY